MDDNRTRHDPVVDLGHRPHIDPHTPSDPARAPATPHHVPGPATSGSRGDGAAGGTPVDGSKLSAEELDQLTADIVTARIRVPPSSSISLR